MKIQVYTDGASQGNPGNASIGVVIKDGSKTIEEICSYIGKTTNNIAEYLAFIRGVEEVLIKGYKQAVFYADSELLVRQLKGKYKVKNENLKPLYYHVLTLLEKLDKFTINHIPREQNKHADKLANEALKIHVEANSPLFGSRSQKK